VLEKALKAMMAKHKGGHDMSEDEKKAKMSVLQDLKSQAMEEMGHGLKGIGKVAVASDSPEGLKHGLEKAKDMVDMADHEHDNDKDFGMMGLDSEKDENEPHEAGDAVEREADAHSEDADEDSEAVPGEEEHEAHMSHDEIDAEIERLKKLKQKNPKA
jgi:hypothetical protein